jgi:DNA-binding transcriptional MerR regulator
MRAALIEQAKEHSAELAAQKRMIERLQQLLEEQKEKHAKAIADLKKALRDALAAARKKCAADISNLEKKHAEELAKKCRIID